MKILAVAPYVPYEGIPHAGGAYLLQHLQEMARRGHDVSLIAPGTPEQLANVPSAPGWLDLVMGPPVLAGRSTKRRLQDAAYRRAMSSPPAPSAESLRSVVDAGLTARARGADVVELHWAEYARFASRLRRAVVSAPIAVVEHDVDLHAITGRVRDNARGYRRALGLMTAPLARRLERRGLIDADVVLVFKRADQAIIRDAGITTPVRVIDPWLDPPTGCAAQRSGATVLFTGALWRRENAAGLMWFLQQVWPRVSSCRPEARFEIVGAAPTAELTAQALRTPGVVLVGEVLDMGPYYEAAAVFVAPLFVRGGLKFKVPQAMSHGLPVVATTVACEGVVEVAPANALWLVTDDAVQMAVGIVSALAEPARAAQVGAMAARWCREFYSFSRSITDLIDLYAGMSTHTRPQGR